MLSSLLIAAAFQVGPFYQQKSDYRAVRPFYSAEAETTDVLWPVFTAHRDWWRFCFFTHYQSNDSGYQFEIMPLWWNGCAGEESYFGLFPLYGTHPHILTLYDWEFALWPLWMRYRTKADRGEDGWLTSNVVLFPFFHWRSDGSWGAWPICGTGHRRESDHHYCFWPIATWATYRADRDTAGAGYSWMFWPLFASVNREREQQTMVFPPLFAHAKTTDGTTQWKCPWPLVEVERGRRRDRTSVFPFYEHVTDKAYGDGAQVSEVMRFGWRLVELYDDETRVFPFYASGRDHFRIWPFWEAEVTEAGAVSYSRTLSLFPIRWADGVTRNWSKFWTFYEREQNPVETRHSLLWGIIRWRNTND